MFFSKMQGAGNDFIIINNMDGSIPAGDYSGIAKKLCRAHFSIGADAVMFVCPPLEGGDYRMLFYNRDGTLGEMCGNGARCICRYGHDNGLAGSIQRVETTAGLVTGERIDEALYKIRLPDPEGFESGIAIEAAGRNFSCCYVELGHPGIPHAVTLMPEWPEIPREELFEYGKALRSYSGFPKGANVTFVSLLSDNYVKAVTFERGVEDFTFACGTGCGAVTFSLIRTGVLDEGPVQVEMPGGVLTVEPVKTDAEYSLYLTGPAELSFTGEVNI